MGHFGGCSPAQQQEHHPSFFLFLALEVPFYSARDVEHIDPSVESGHDPCSIFTSPQGNDIITQPTFRG